MSDHESAWCMLTAASRDLQAIGNMQDNNLYPNEIFGLHAQQAVEKSLKAWLAWRGQAVPRTHNLRMLLVQAGEDVTREWAFIDLTAFAVQFRYEAWESSDTSMDRDSIVKQVTSLVRRVPRIVEGGVP